MTFIGPQTDTVPIREANELSYEYDGRWDARYSKCGCLDGVSILGMNTNDGQDIRSLGNGHHVLISHVPLTVLNKPFVPPAFALVPVPFSVLSVLSTSIPSGSPLAPLQCVSRHAHLP